MVCFDFFLAISITVEKLDGVAFSPIIPIIRFSTKKWENFKALAKKNPKKGNLWNKL